MRARLSTIQRDCNASWPTRRRGLTLVEVVISTLIVGVMIVAALNSLEASMRSGTSSGNPAVAAGLADELMARLLATPYAELDDYNDLDEQPPEYADGTPIPDRDEWRRIVEVVNVVPTDPTETTSGGSDQGAKRVRVTVEFDGQTFAEQVAVRTSVD